MITANDAATLAIASPNATDLLVLLDKKVLGAATNGQTQVVFSLPGGANLEAVAAEITASLEALGYDVENYDSYLIVKW